jgi:hypothetical protein
MTDRCQPAEHLRGVDGWHWVETPDGQFRFCHRWWKARGTWGWATLDERSARASRYLAPVAPPDLVRELVEALQHADLQLEYIDQRSPSGTTPAVRAQIGHVLHRAKEAGV